MGTCAAKTMGIQHTWKFHASVGIDRIGWVKGFHGVIVRPSRFRRTLATLPQEEKNKTEATVFKKQKLEAEVSLFKTEKMETEASEST